jgi:hypothetical protein
MAGNMIRVAVLSLGTLVSGLMLDRPLPPITDSRVLYLLAQYKMAVGDTDAGMELVRRAADSGQKNGDLQPAASHQVANAAKVKAS